MIDTVIGLIATIRNDRDLPSRIDADTHLLDEVGLDSIEVVELMMGLEDALGMEIPYGSLEREDLATVRTLVEAIREKSA